MSTFCHIRGWEGQFHAGGHLTFPGVVSTASRFTFQSRFPKLALPRERLVLLLLLLQRRQGGCEAASDVVVDERCADQRRSTAG